jgi:hypothetical protein
MRFFLFWLCLIFSGIFYLFSRVSWNTSLWFLNLHNASLSGNLLFETGIFFSIGIVLFWYFSPSSQVFNDQNEQQEKEPLFQFDIYEIFIHLRSFLTKHVYYLGFIFFYFAVYLLFSASSWNIFSYGIFFLNIIFFVLFFLTDKFFILRDFLKINTIIFSCIYIFFYFGSFLGIKSPLQTIDFINTICIIFLFLSLWYRKALEEKKQIDMTLLMYFCLYVLMSGVFYIYIIFGSILMSYSLVAFTIGIILFYIPGYFPILSKSSKILRYISLVLLYSVLISSGLYTILYGLFFIPLATLLVWGVFHYATHYHYENYISFFVSFFHVFFLVSYFFFHFLFVWESTSPLLLFNFLFMSFALLGYSYVSSLRYEHDVLALHIFAYIVNIFWVLLFFIFSEFHIFTLAWILLIESVFVFLSYYRLNKYNYGQNSK